MTGTASPFRASGIEVWRGGVNAWECDEMGHMNTRFYMARCMEGLSVLLAMAGMPGAVAGSDPVVQVREAHNRFHREARMATPLYMEAGFSRIDAEDAEAVLMLRHGGDGSLAATFRMTLAHAGHWSDDFRARAPAMTLDIPKEAQPRSVGTGVPAHVALDRHARIALGSIMPADCDASGRMAPQKFSGMVSDGVRQITAPLRQIVVDNAEAAVPKVGGAVLEMRAVYMRMPALGDLFEVRSAFRGADARTLTLEHWMIDPLTGGRWGYMESIAVVFDIEKRAIVGITEAAQAALRPLALGD
jgi:acyl-CoA thioester hydrolase